MGTGIWSTLWVLVKKELRLELRRQAVLSGIALYLFSLVFIGYLIFRMRQNSLNDNTWSALFWLIVLFAVVNGVAKSFMEEKKGVFIYLYAMASPQSIILSKILYNGLLCTFLSLLGYGLMHLFLGSPIVHHGVFFTTLVLASFGFSSSLSLISGIASKASNSNVLMAVLSFPVVIALLLISIGLTKSAILGLDWEDSWRSLLNLVAINSISSALAYLLFPYIWRS